MEPDRRSAVIRLSKLIERSNPDKKAKDTKRLLHVKTV